MRLKEADRIVTLLTESRGKISALAKGIRRAKSKFGARLEPFNLVELLIYKGSSLDIITSVEIIDSFPRLRDDFEKSNIALAMLDLVDKVMIDQPDKRIFDFLLTGLSALSDLSDNLDLFLTAFDIKLLSLSGFMPVLSRCLSCHRPISKSLAIFVTPQSGGIICSDCRSQAIISGETDKSVSISQEAAELIVALIKATKQDISSMKVKELLKSEVLSTISFYVDHHLTYRLKSRDCIKRINSSFKGPRAQP